MTNNKVLLMVASWEERFCEGAKSSLSRETPSEVIVLYSGEYEERTSSNRELVQKACAERGVLYSESKHVFSDQKSCFESILRIISEVQRKGVLKVEFDISTAPREIIWYVLHFLDVLKLNTDILYFRALQYGAWLSRDVLSPKLVIKRSGIMYPDLPTAILILSGFDDQRLWQLVRKFEPKKILVGVQTGAQLENRERNRPNASEFAENVEYFNFDCFDTTDHSLTQLVDRVHPYLDGHNILAASLGPKPGATTLYRLTQKFPQIGLVYIPAREYNIDYSVGIDLSNVCRFELFGCPSVAQTPGSGFTFDIG